MLIKLVPKIFFDRMGDGIDLFVDCLGFEVLLRDKYLAVIGRDGAKAYLVEDPEFAAKDRPEVAIETDDIDGEFAKVAGRRPDMLHPNAKAIVTKPWGCREFAVLDKTGVCVIFRQWPAA
jgi:hypothetical protein